MIMGLNHILHVLVNGPSLDKPLKSYSYVYLVLLFIIQTNDKNNMSRTLFVVYLLLFYLLQQRTCSLI